MDTVTLRGAFDEFLECVGRSQSTQKNYKNRTRIFLRDYGKMNPRDLKRSHVNKWYNELVDSGDYKPVTLSGYRQAIKAFFNWLSEDGYIDVNVANHLKAGNFISNKSRVPNENDVKKVTAIALEWMESDLGTERRAACFWFWSLESGGRIGGLCNIRLDEYLRGRERPDANGVYQFNTFSKGKEVILEVTERTLKATDTWLEVRPESDRPELITTIWHPTHPVNRIVTEQACKSFKIISKAAGLKEYITSHMLRHRLGTLLIQMYDAKIAAMKLCHADAHTTAQTAIAFYYRPDRSAVSRATAALAT